MKILQLLTPIRDLAWLSSTDTVRDAFDHMEEHGVTAAPLLDWNRRYLGTVTEADLRRHVAATLDRMTALGTPLSELDRRARTEAVTADREIDAIVALARAQPFVPVVDDRGRLLGVVDRRRVLEHELPTAA
jgi:CBS-domain-containing membrane protein